MIEWLQQKMQEYKNMELRLLRYFLTVAKEQSFTKAAEQLHITQPTLSRQMAAFEEELGVTLFIRSGKKISLTDDEILSILHCVEATTVSKERDSYIFRAADSTEVMGLVVSGCVLVIQEDLWGHRNILSKCHVGDFFGEPYAASPGAVLNISVVADEDCEIILLNIQRLLVTCPTACEHHQKLIRNLVSVLANKILILNDKITHVGKRTTRDKLLSYLSAESIRHSSLSFDIPFDRQQLADYLCIDRAAMSTEISKLQKEGFIKTNRNHFELAVSKNVVSRMMGRAIY